MSDKLEVTEEMGKNSGGGGTMKTKENEHSWLPIGIACALVLMVIVFTIVQLTASKEKGDYIGGNILYMPYTGDISEGWPEHPVLTKPWRYMHFQTALMWRTLLIADSSFETTKPDLAKGVVVSEDGLTYTIVMKDNVVWSDGTPLTVEDVVWSMETILIAESSNAIITSAFSRIKGAAEHIADPSLGLAGLSVDGNSITMTLDEPYLQMEMALSQFAILPKHILQDTDLTRINLEESIWTNPVVCGMYVTDANHDGEFVKWVKNEYYEGTEPNIDEIHFITDYQDSSDYRSTSNIDDLTLYRAKRGMVEYPIETLVFRYFIFNMEGVDGNQNEAMQDVRVRKALGHAIDRESLLRKVYLNMGTIVDSGVPAYHSAFAEDINDMEYNPEKAKELLKEAGYDFERPIRMTYYYGDPVSLAFVEGVAANLEAVGLKVDLFHVKETDMDTSGFLYGDGEGAREFDIALKGYSAFSVYESFIEYSSSNANISMLFGGVTEFDDVVNRLYASQNQEEGEAVLKELQALENKHYFKLPLFTMNQTVFINGDRVDIPEGITFGNTYYRFDSKFEEWSIKRESK